MSTPIQVSSYNCNKCGQALPVPKEITALIICERCQPHLKHLIRSHHVERPDPVQGFRRIVREEIG